MNFEIPASRLNSELERLVSIAAGNNKTNPILEYAHLEPLGKSLRLTTTDTRETLECLIDDVSIENPERLCLPAKRLYNLTKLFAPEAPVKFVTEANGQIRVLQGKSKFRLSTVSPGSFPAVLSSTEKLLELPAADLRRMIRLSSNFVGEDDSRFAFSGAELDVSAGVVSLVATDGQRLAYAELPPGQFDKELTVLIPQKGLKQLASLLNGVDGTVQISGCRAPAGGFRSVCFDVGTRRLTVLLTTGTFPQYQLMFKSVEDHPHKASIERAEFHNALKRLQAVLDDRTKFARLDFGRGAVRISSNKKDVGDGVEEVALEHKLNLPDKVTSVGVNLDFILEFLSAAGDITPRDGACVSITYKDSASFLELNIEDTAQVFRYLLAPLRIVDEQ
jgi:DNA polymerase-3 subunit beta